MLEDIERLASGLAAAHGAKAEIELTSGYPVTVNDEGAARFALDTVASLFGQKAAFELPAPVMGAED